MPKINWIRTHSLHTSAPRKINRVRLYLVEAVGEVRTLCESDEPLTPLQPDLCPALITLVNNLHAHRRNVPPHSLRSVCTYMAYTLPIVLNS